MRDPENQKKSHILKEVSTARIIPKEEHPITVDQIDPDALFVLRKLKRSGFCGYLVGGGVRDLYLGNIPKDFDISTDARPGQLRRLFRNSATIGRRFKLVQLFFKHAKIIEVSTLRSLSEHDLDGPEAILAPNNTFGTLDQDALRRDLTINSLFYEIEQQTIIDHTGGVDDLDHSIIRVVGDPDIRFTRDPVRILRTIRHAARNNFSIEPKSWNGILTNHRKLTFCPPSRLRDELFKDLYSGVACPWFKLAEESGVFSSLFPVYPPQIFHNSRKDIGVRDQLFKLLTVIDRINTLQKGRKISRPPDYFILALILIPWAHSEFNILDLNLKGPTLFQLSKQIRSRIDSQLGTPLNLRRSLRQEATSLLTNLAQFSFFNKKKKFPQWFKKKSYFEKANLFYHCYLEAETGKPVPDKLLHLKTGRHKNSSPPRKRRSSSRPKTRPAFKGKGKGSVFGLKK